MRLLTIFVRRILLLGAVVTAPTFAQDSNLEVQQREMLFNVVSSIGNEVPDGMAPWLDVLSLTLKLGNDPNTRFGNSGWTPLHLLTFRPIMLMEENVPFSDEMKAACIEGVRLLLSAGANPNIQDAAGQTPLHGAVTFDSIEPVKMLLDAGADPNIPNLNGRTALHIAIDGKNETGVSILLEAGAQL